DRLRPQHCRGGLPAPIRVQPQVRTLCRYRSRARFRTGGRLPRGPWRHGRRHPVRPRPAHVVLELGGSNDMVFVTRKALLAIVVLAALVVAAIAGFIWSGFYNVAADDPHTAPVYSLLETMRKRSIQVRAGQLEVPSDLTDQ